jgi:phosphate transport system substrate-binding protein
VIHASRFVAAAGVLTALASGSLQAQGVDLTGAGATFPNPLYTAWTHAYDVATKVKVNYQSIGSGGGIRQITEQTVDFGATDGPMTDEELSKAKGGAIMHFPTVLGADVLIYNVPEITQALKLTGPVIADIFLGKITKWNDPRIATLNSGVKLPPADILVVHRSDGSGTTFIFTDYLTNVSADWAKVVGRGKEVKWPVGLGAKGNEGVSGQVKQTPGSIGYTELTYARQNKLAYAHVQNAAGKFVEPTIESISAAAGGAQLPANTDWRVSIVNAAGANAYPIASFTWLLVYRNQADPVKGKKLKDFMRWFYGEGQKAAPALDYGPLPAALTRRLIARLDSIQVAGTK